MRKIDTSEINIPAGAGIVLESHDLTKVSMDAS